MGVSGGRVAASGSSRTGAKMTRGSAGLSALLVRSTDDLARECRTRAWAGFARFASGRGLVSLESAGRAPAIRPPAHAMRSLPLAALTFAALGAGACLPAALGAQSAADLDRFFRSAGLTPQEIQRALSGSAVVRELPARDRNEVAVFGVIAVAAPYETARAQLRDWRGWLSRATGRTAMGVFGTPAESGDAAALRVDPSDLEAFRGCKPGDCDIKLPASSMREFQAALDWSKPTVASDAAALVRARLARYANDYRRLGTAAVVEYADRATPTAASDVFERLLSDSPYLLEYVPALHRHLRDFPSAPLAGATDAMLWAVDKLPSLRPITSLEHATYYELPDASVALLGEKQLYASHYFDGAFLLTTLVPRPDGAGSLLIVIRRLHFDNLPSGGLLNIRGRVIGKLKDALADELGARAAALNQR